MADNKISADDFVQTKIQPEYREIAHKLRSLIQKYAPEAQEYII